MLVLKIIAVAIGGILMVHLIASGLYIELGWFKFFYHDILEWHLPVDDDANMYRDGKHMHSKCKYCGEDIVKDGRGQWF